jgi:PAS domain S-box-containing protein
MSTVSSASFAPHSINTYGLARTLAWGAAAIALAAITGWIAGIPLLARLVPLTEPLKMNAAVGLLALSGSIVVATRRARGGVTALALVAFAIGAATAIEHAFAIDLGIDEILVAESQRSVRPGRMSIEASVALMILGIAIPLRVRSNRDRLSGGIAALVSLGALFVLLRYLFFVPDLRELGARVHLSLGGALALLMLGLATAALRPGQGWFGLLERGETAPARLARLIVPFAVAIPIASAWARLAAERAGILTRESSAALGVGLTSVLFIAAVLASAMGLHRSVLAQAAKDEELRRSEERFRLAALATSDALYDWDVTGGVLWWGDGVRTLFGWHPDEVRTDLGWWSERIHPEERDTVLSSLDATVLGRGSGWSMEYRFRHRDGSWRDVLERGFVIRDAAGSAERMIGSLTDLTERKSAERLLRSANEELERRVAERTEELQRANERLADEVMIRRNAEIDLLGERDFVTAILETLATVLVVIDPTGRVVRMNPAAERLTGWSAEQIGSTPLWETLIPEEEREAVLGVFRDLRAGDFPSTFENHWKTKAGELRRIAWSNNALVGKDGGIRFIIGSGVDVTAERRAQQEQARQKRELELATVALAESNRELEAFSYSVSHDLRAPLRAIEGFARALEEDAGPLLSGSALDALRRIRAASIRMGELIDALLTLSRIARSELRHDAVALSALAAEVVERLRAADPARRVEVVVTPGLQASGDSRLLRIVLENLIGNAWKFTARTEGSRIEVGQALRPEGAAYYVRDNGAGFDMAYASKLFAPFQRLHSLSEFPGTGIGLATVQRIVARHGGNVWAEAAPGRGATFYFTLGS